jgi:tetratricopeptide (TPR) repeat protein
VLRELAEAYPDSREVVGPSKRHCSRAGGCAQPSSRAVGGGLAQDRVYGGIVALLALLAVGGARAIGRPALQELREQARLAQIARQVQRCNADLAAGDLDAAEQCYREVLADEADNAAALNGLETIAEQRELATLYNQAVAAEMAGDYESALSQFTDLAVRAPNYKDVAKRVTDLGRLRAVASLYEQAEVEYAAGNAGQALELYRQVRQQSTSYQAGAVVERLIALYLELGRDILALNPPDLDRIEEARGYFEECLTLAPRNADALEELRLVRLYVDGKASYDQGNWADAIARLRAIHDQRAGYLSGQVASVLYDAYVRYGDAWQQAGDLALAYEQYRLASILPVHDRTLALERLAAVQPLLTPTPTPQPTGTPRPAAASGPTAEPTPRPLSAYSGYIAFYSDDEESPGIWVMDSRGENRQYLGNGRILRREYDALVEASRYSPDGRYRVYVGDVNGRAQLFVQPPSEDEQPVAAERIAKLTGICYDPVWSPDGTRIAFVSQENGTDDIWVVNADGTNNHNLTRNTWEWDKHPSWSPDSTRIVFWSNRYGRKQIFVMDAEGREAVSISQGEWDEYDPIWIP